MKYLSFEANELNELIAKKRRSFVMYLVFFFVVMIGTYLIVYSSMPYYFGVSRGLIVMLLPITYLSFVINSNKAFIDDLVRKEKKVFFGVLSVKIKRVDSGKYLFNLDGNIFQVEKNIYDKFNEGDIIEIHIASKSKCIFKVLKHSENNFYPKLANCA